MKDARKTEKFLFVICQPWLCVWSRRVVVKFSVFLSEQEFSCDRKSHRGTFKNYRTVNP